MIHCSSVTDVFTKGKMTLWLMSAFKAGFINSSGFLLTGKYVSHVTGFGTQVGMAMGHDDIFFGAELLIIPFSFILGGVLTSLLLEPRIDDNSRPPYHYVQGLITLLIGVVIFLGESGLISSQAPFDSDQHYNFIEFSVIALLCLICGLKNSLVTWTTYGKIRVTHLTGLSTDIGLNFIGMFRPRSENARYKESKIISFHRIGTFVAFSSGAFISAIVFPRIGYQGFFIVFGISMFMTILSVLDRKNTSHVTKKVAVSVTR
jgi:uncharacterized membrane protein YoaK (UPF0700 family)